MLLKLSDRKTARPFILSEEAAQELGVFRRTWRTLGRTAFLVCDGRRDNDEINEAFAHLPKNPGGKVTLSEGTFTLGTDEGDQINPISYSTLEGQGYATDIYHPATTGTTSETGIEINDVTSVVVRHLRVRGSGVLHGAGLPACIRIIGTSNKILIEDVDIESAPYDGILIMDGEVGDTGGPYRISVIGCRVTDSEDDGINIAAINSAAAITDVLLRNNWVWNINGTGGTGAGIHLSVNHADHNNVLSRITIEGNHIRDTSEAGIDIVGDASAGTIDHIAIIGNSVFDTALEGIQTSYTDYSVIANNVVETCGRNGIGIWLSDKTLVKGNNIRDVNNGLGAYHGIFENGGTNCVIANNIVDDVAGDAAGEGAGIKLAGTSAICKGNNVLNTYGAPIIITGTDNQVVDNIVDEISSDSGTRTRFKSRFFPVWDASGATATDINGYHVIELTQGTTDKCRVSFSVPFDWRLTREFNLVWIAGGTAAATYVDLNFDAATNNEANNTHEQDTADVALGTPTIGRLYKSDIKAYMPSALTIKDICALIITQSGADVVVNVVGIEWVYE